MAEVSYATAARIVEFAMTPATPGQISHPIPSTGTVRTLSLGHGLWRGVVRFGVLKGNAVGEIEAMLAALDGANNYLELPIRGRRVPAGDASITAASGTGYTVSGATLAPGMYVRARNRVFTVTGVSGGTVSLWPTLPLDTSDTLVPASTIRAMSRGAGPDLSVTPHWGGPWVWNWQEHVG